MKFKQSSLGDKRSILLAQKLRRAEALSRSDKGTDGWREPGSEVGGGGETDMRTPGTVGRTGWAVG